MTNDMEQSLSAYLTQGSDQSEVGLAGLTSRLQQLPIMIAAATETLQDALAKHYPDSRFSPTHYQVVRFVDTVVSDLTHQTEAGERIELLARQLAPLLAVDLLESLSSESFAVDVKGDNPVFDLYNLLLTECVGWTEDLGALGEQFLQTFEDRINATLHGRMDLEKCISLLRDFCHRHNAHGKVREHRLAEDAIKQQHFDFARRQSAAVINRFLRGTRLPLFSIFALQGVWFEFLQNVCLTYGTNSRHWRYGARLTDALIKSLQPDCREGIREHLPVKIRDWCGSIKVETTAMEDFLDDLCNEYEKLEQDPAMSLCVADPIPIREDSIRPQNQEDHPLQDICEGQWILYADPSAPTEKTARLRCLHNFKQGSTLICSNMNRRKTICLSYDSVAHGITNKTARLLPRQVDLLRTINHQLAHLAANPDSVPGKDRGALLAEKLRKKRSRILARKSRIKLQLALSRVMDLQTNAWVRLPLMQGAMTPCRLIAIVGESDKYIFANRGGVKVAEYTRSQLANLMVTENSEILDTGEEFAEVLDNVVTNKQSATKKRPETGSALR